MEVLKPNAYSNFRYVYQLSLLCITVVYIHLLCSDFYYSTVPSPPRMLTMTATPTGSTVELNWLPPLHPNGDIRYEIEYEPAMTPGDPVNAGNSSDLYFTLTLPNEFLSYTVRVAAVNSKLRTKSSHLLSCLGKNRERGTLATQQQLLHLCTDLSVTCLWNSIHTLSSNCC